VSQTVKKWSCKKCGHEFYPTPPDFNCPRCHTNITVPIMDSGPITIQPPKQKVTDMPKPDEPLVCSFQRRYPSGNIKCALTARQGTLPLDTYFDPCSIDTCPMFQTWKLLKKPLEVNMCA
jgi:hypothetical protein